MQRFFLAFIVTGMLTSCESSSILVRPNPFIGQTAAQQALDGSAHNIALVSPKKLLPGHIYKVADNDFKEICGKDIEQQNRLKTLAPVKVDEKTETIADRPRDLEIEVLGQSLATYNSIKVKGYQTYDVRDGNTPVDASYILSNVKRGKDSCFDAVLPRNKPYLVVDQVAVGSEIETWYKRGFGASVGFGPFRAGFKPKEEKTGTRSDRVFGATGTLVR
ncbi:MAG: hypothetical protein J7562_02290 [Agrobacterium tumefaciens]|nr:hypothetical protein [Agrobacterium tumefaciens]